MTMSAFICGGDERPGPRAACPNQLHDWPLPAGYSDAADAAASRLYRGWKNKRCPDCGIYGWMPGEVRNETPAESDEPCPTCSGPIRETVGMACQTCGHDYATDQPDGAQ